MLVVLLLACLAEDGDIRVPSAPIVGVEDEYTVLVESWSTDGTWGDWEMESSENGCFAFTAFTAHDESGFLELVDRDPWLFETVGWDQVISLGDHAVLMESHGCQSGLYPFVLEFYGNAWAYGGETFPGGQKLGVLRFEGEGTYAYSQSTWRVLIAVVDDEVPDSVRVESYRGR